MARCEDWPCCGHELGCCPDYDGAGRQLNMRCTCGAVLPLHNRYSLCDHCLRHDPEDPDSWDDERPDDDWDDDEEDEDEDYDEDDEVDNDWYDDE